MAPLHAFKDQIVAGLEAEVQMRHNTRLIGDDLDQVVVESRRVEENRRRAKSGTRANSGAPDWPGPAGPANRRHRRRCRRRSARPPDSRWRPGRAPGRQSRPGQRAIVAAAVGDDAKSAAMVAALLNLHEGAAAPVKPLIKCGAVSRTVMISATATGAASAGGSIARRRVFPHCPTPGRPRPCPRSRPGRSAPRSR